MTVCVHCSQRYAVSVCVVVHHLWSKVFVNSESLTGSHLPNDVGRKKCTLHSFILSVCAEFTTCGHSLPWYGLVVPCHIQSIMSDHHSPTLQRSHFWRVSEKWSGLLNNATLEIQGQYSVVVCIYCWDNYDIIIFKFLGGGGISVPLPYKTLSNDLVFPMCL